MKSKPRMDRISHQFVAQFSQGYKKVRRIFSNASWNLFRHYFFTSYCTFHFWWISRWKWFFWRMNGSFYDHPLSEKSLKGLSQFFLESYTLFWHFCVQHFATSYKIRTFEKKLNLISNVTKLRESSGKPTPTIVVVIRGCKWKESEFVGVLSILGGYFFTFWPGRKVVTEFFFGRKFLNIEYF